MKLIRIHKPKSKDELVELIKKHFEEDCNCGIKSQGTVEDFGRNLYNSQIKYWGEYRYSLKDCIQWEYDLFVVQSLKGNIVEKKAEKILRQALPEYLFEEAEGYLDEELRIDILVKLDDEEKCGIQVKPVTFNKMRPEVILFNKGANKRWGKPVYYMFYDDNELFQNVEDIVVKIKNI